MPEPHRRDLSRYYDDMHMWTRLNRGFRRFSGHEAHTIHRWLVDPATDTFSPQTIHALISQYIPAAPPPVALDAGCGYGGTALALHARHGGTWHGVTLSPRQCAQGNRIAASRGVAGDVTISHGSYDDPRQASYSLIYGIESLIHSPDPAVTIRALSSVLAPSGTFIIVDDMPADTVPDALAVDLARFKELWRCPVMPTANEWSRLLEVNGCRVTAVESLAHLMRPRSEPEIAQALEEVAARHRRRRWFGLRRIGEAEIGGLLLERLGRERAVDYTMIVARKSA